MPELNYPAKLTRGTDGRILVEFADFPRAATDGADLEEAMSEAADCLVSTIEFCMRNGESIPLSSGEKRNHRLIPVPLYLAVKVALYTAMRRQGFDVATLASRLRIRESNVRRLLDPAQNSSPETLEAALKALGRSVVLSVAPVRAVTSFRTRNCVAHQRLSRRPVCYCWARRLNNQSAKKARAHDAKNHRRNRPD
jgi:antitoxin HicB